MGNREFIYWKRPWHKWAIIIGAFSQLLCLWMNVREYSRIARAGVLSAEQWASYALTAQWQCAVNGVAAACFLGIFLIGTFARSKKEARLGGHFVRKSPPKHLLRRPNVIELQVYSTLWR